MSRILRLLARPRRLLGLAILVILVVVGWSYMHALTLPGTDSLGAKSVEWVRSHGGSGLVTWIEKEWYSHHPPAASGMPAASEIPVFPAVAYPSGTKGLARPKDVRPIVPGTVVGEGHWVPVGQPVSGAAAVYATFVRPDPAHPRLITGVAWMDTKALRAELFAGYQVPGGGGWSPTAPVKPADGQLVAAFNSGFRLQDASGSGYYDKGRTARPIVNGYASLVFYRDGTVNVGAWGREVTASPDVVSIRQNLNLIVDNGKLVPGLKDKQFQKWGATLGNNLYVWRSGAGVTANGAIVYAGGPGLSIYTLADVLRRSGAVRAMELDINTDWVDFFFFNPPSGTAAGPSDAGKLLPAMVASKSRYFEPSSRDFIALFARS